MMTPSKKLSICTLFLLFCSVSKGQEKLSLTIGDAIRTAQDSTVTAYINEVSRQKAEWEYRQFLAGRKFQLSIIVNPTYNKYVNTPYLDYFKEYNYNILGARAEIRLEQQMNSLGGEFYAATSALYNEYLAGCKDIDRIFNSIPLGIGYTNELLGYNPYKWEKEIETIKFEAASKKYSYNLQQIALEASSYYLDYLVASEELRICRTNLDVLTRLYEIAKEKIEIAAITKSELISIQLQYVNAQNSIYSHEQTVNDCRKELLSYLRIEDHGQVLEAKIPEPAGTLEINNDDVVSYALANSPRMMEVKEKILKSRQAADKSNIEKGLQLGLDVNVGVQSNSSRIASLFDVPASFAVVGVGLSIPLVDHGLAASRSKAAESEVKIAELEEEDLTRLLILEATSTLSDFISQQTILRRTMETLDLADESFQLVEDLYTSGLSDINTFLLSQISKDNSYQNYLESLRKYWESYYKLQALCLYDFIRNEPLQWN